EARADAVRRIVEMGVPVMGHLGFTPQSVHALGGARVQGRSEGGEQQLVDDAKRLEDAGAFAIVLELVPAAVARRVTEAVRVPTIGIGAGAGCDGQVLVLHDMLGLNSGFSPKFLKRYAELGTAARQAIETFAAETRGGRFPDDAHSF
ncbi:MAG TPA: 3-methyl-2-oxobutanoate hydroxymethyltransferase, partial [Gemmatimonadaceae bacterium]|nr:3-methyl-2-oxobutanoate hydroxymethyltransferase [Gemmatimonadaceae bacterium]